MEWADVPPPGNMADFDRDTELEEGGPEPVKSVLTTDDSDYWDLDDWGDDE